LFTVGDIDHILSRLCGTIATFQPVTVSALFRRNGYADVLHDILQTTSGTTSDTLWRIDAGDTKGLQPSERLSSTCHREDEIRKSRIIRITRRFRSTQTVFTDKADFIASSLQSVDD
jgi:hypothetical protein